MKLLLISAFFVTFLHSEASAYEVRKSRTGAPLRWAAGTIDINLYLDLPEIDEAAARAFATFSDALGGMTSELALAVRTRAGAVPDVDAEDGQTTVRWQEDGFADDYDADALAITITTYQTSSGRITDADILLNADYGWWTGADDCHGAYDVQAIVTHEVGHLLGLAHDDGNTDSTMYPTASTCETLKRDLADGDLEGLAYLYQVVGPAPDAGCGVGGTRGAAGGMWLVGLAAALLATQRPRRRPRRLAVPVALVLALVLAGPAQATTMRRVPLSAAGKAAGLVVRAKVHEVAFSKQDGRIYTDARLRVVECLKGACAAEVTIRQLGGELDGEGMVLEGAAAFATGDEVVVFLRPRRDGTYAPVGMAQGVLRVERSGALVRDLRGMELVGEGRAGLERLSLRDVRRALLVTDAPRDGSTN